MRGTVLWVTIGAAVGFVAAWFLPWMADTPAFPLIGHGLTTHGFLFETPPGAGTSLELALFGLLGLAAFVAAFLMVPVPSLVIVVLAGAAGIHLALRDHPGLSSGPGAVVATVALVVLAAAQTAAIWPAVGKFAIVAMVLAVAVGGVGFVYVTARDTDVTTSTAQTAVMLREQHGTLSGITAVDATSGAERWHDWERDWTGPEIGLSPDGATAYLVVSKTTGSYALAFAAATGKLLWQKELQSEPWVDRIGGPSLVNVDRLPVGSGLVQYKGNNELRYLDADGRDGLIRLDDRCNNVIGAGGVRRMYLVAECGNAAFRVVAADRNATELWSTMAFLPASYPYKATVDDHGDTITIGVNGLDATLDAGTGRVHR